MHVIVIGAGAVGSIVAADLSENGAEHGIDVTLIARGERLNWLAQHPLEIIHEGRITRYQPAVLGWDRLSRKADIAVICTKTCDFSEAVAALQPHLAPEGIVLTLQNGVEAGALAAGALPGATVMAGRVHGFFEMDGQIVRHTGVQPSIRFGCVHGARAGAAAMLATVLDKTRYTTMAVDDITSALWEKLLITAGVGGLAAALGCPAGMVCKQPEGRDQLARAMQEIVAVGRQHGATLGQEDIDRQMAFVEAFPADVTTSLQRDLQDHRPSEYDALVGAVLRFAAKSGIPVPTFREIAGAIQARYGVIAP